MPEDKKIRDLLYLFQWALCSRSSNLGGPRLYRSLPCGLCQAGNGRDLLVECQHTTGCPFCYQELRSKKQRASVLFLCAMTLLRQTDDSLMAFPEAKAPCSSRAGDGAGWEYQRKVFRGHGCCQQLGNIQNEWTSSYWPWYFLLYFLDRSCFRINSCKDTYDATGQFTLFFTG